MPLNNRLQQAIASWPEWDAPLATQPDVICLLSGGLTNTTYLLSCSGQKMVLRLNASNSEQLGINRQVEAVILGLVSEAEIAPMVHYCSPEKGVLVSEFVDGQSLDITRPDTISRVQSLLEQVHALKPDIPAFDYIQHVQSYQSAVGPHDSYAQINPLLDKLQAASGGGLCHHDPNPGNFIDVNGRLYLLDWEYAGLGAPEFDQAAARAEFSTYCDAIRASNELVNASDRVYQHICQLWKKLNSSHFS